MKQDKSKSIPVTTVAEVMTCQRRVYLRPRHKEAVSLQMRTNRDRGIAIHKEAERLGDRAYKATGTDKRCFIATTLFGAEAHETNVLRDYRDRVLRRNAGGRTLVSIYYKVSPSIADLLDSNEVIRKFAAALVRSIVRAIERRK